MLGGLVIGKVIEQDRAQNRALRFYVRGKSADAVICGRHISLQTSRAPLWRNLSASISEAKPKRQMNCGEAAKLGEDAVKAPRHQVRKRIHGQTLEDTPNSVAKSLKLD